MNALSTLPAARLQRTLELASTWEEGVGPFRKPFNIVAFGSVVRARRLASAVAVLGTSHAYEARLLVRALLETYFNYAWIRLRRRHSRAIRFLRYEVLERLRLAEELARNSGRATNLDVDIRRLRSQRTRLRHLFRVKDRKGKRRWASNWAGGISVEQRLREVVTAARAAGQHTDEFMYTLYRWLSGPVHGNVTSFDDILVRQGGLLRAAENDGLASNDCHDAATGVLLAIWSVASIDLELPRHVRAAAKRNLAEFRESLARERRGVQRTGEADGQPVHMRSSW